MQSSVIEIIGPNVSTNFISCPSDPNQTLGIKMPYLVLLIKYVKLHFKLLSLKNISLSKYKLSMIKMLEEDSEHQITK